VIWSRSLILLKVGLAHARRVYSGHGIGLSAPISAEGVQNKQPLVALSVEQRKSRNDTENAAGILSVNSVFSVVQ
jgi:hypothetical protein